MDVTVHCPQCETCLSFPAGDAAATCDACLHVMTLEAPSGGSILRRCVVCGEHRLYRQKDLHRKRGLAVVLGTAAVSLALLPFSPMAAYGVLFLLTLVDLALYRRLPEVIICYRCKAQHRRCGAQAQVEPFDLLTAEVIDNQIREQEEENRPAGA
jgi:hypothetical protein